MKKMFAKTVYWLVLLGWLAAAAKLGWMIYTREFRAPHSEIRIPSE